MKGGKRGEEREEGEGRKRRWERGRKGGGRGKREEEGGTKTKKREQSLYLCYCTDNIARVQLCAIAHASFSSEGEVFREQTLLAEEKGDPTDSILVQNSLFTLHMYAHTNTSHMTMVTKIQSNEMVT